MRVADEFNARYSALERCYRYVLLNHAVRPAVNQGRVAWTHTPLDILRMREAVQYLLGEHDFSAFAASDVRDSEGGSVTIVDSAGNGEQPVRPRDHLLGEAAHHRGPHDPVANGDTAHSVADLLDHTGEFAPRHERGRDGELVVIGDKQHIREVDSCSGNSHPHLPSAQRRRGQFLDGYDLRLSVGMTDGSSHISGLSMREGASRRRHEPPPWHPRC